MQKARHESGYESLFGNGLGNAVSLLLSMSVSPPGGGQLDDVNYLE